MRGWAVEWETTVYFQFHANPAKGFETIRVLNKNKLTINTKPCEPLCEPPNAETQPATSPAMSSLAKSRITRYGRIVKPNPKYISW